MKKLTFFIFIKFTFFPIPRLESLLGISRREFLGSFPVKAGEVAAVFLGSMGAFHILANRDVKQNIGRVVSLAVSQEYSLPGSGKGNVTYSGMPNDQRFLLYHQHEDVRYITNTPLYFSKNDKQITLRGHQFSVLEVTPDKLVLEYLGREQS